MLPRPRSVCGSDPIRLESGMTAATRTSGRSGLSAWRMAALRTALWMLVAAGPVGAVAVWTQLDAIDSQLQLLAEQAGSTQVVDTAEVEGVAELAIADLLTASASSESPTPAVVGTVSLGAVEVHTDYFAVTVAATNPGSEVIGPLRIYLVGIVSTGSGWAVAGPPALVTSPETSEAPDLAVAMTGLEDTPGLAEATGGFLAAYLTGDGDVTRYTAPGSPISGIAPAPFVAVKVLEAGSITHDDRGRLVVVTVEATDPAEDVQVLRYSMIVVEESGRWEVTELLPAPPLEEGSSDD